MSLPDPLPLDDALRQMRASGYARLSTAALARLSGTAASALAALTPAWHHLPPDQYLKDGGRYRRRRHGSWVWQANGPTLRQVPHRPHWQPTDYNALHGGMLREFEPIEARVAQSPAFLGLLQGLSAQFAEMAHAQPARAGEPVFDGRWFIEAHTFRIDTEGGVGRPTPEGAHRDGMAYVAVILVDRAGIVGGETRVFEADGPHGVRFTLTEPWSALLLDDARVIHESTPIQPQQPGVLGHRDTLVITFRAQAFQDPPA